MTAGGIQVIQVGLPLQQHDLGLGYLFILRMGDADHRAADADCHRAGLNVQAFIFVQFFADVQENPAFHQVQPQMIGFFNEFHPRFGVQGNDLAVIQADGSKAFLPCPHNLAAGEADVFEHETGLSFRIEDLHIALIAQQPHGSGVVAFSKGRSAEGQRKNQDKNDHGFRRSETFPVHFISFLLLIQAEPGSVSGAPG